jgi:hypothetical protein
MPSWPALLPIDLACLYCQMGADSFRFFTRQHGVVPVDTGLTMTRYRRSDLDRMIDSLPARGAEMRPEAHANDPPPVDDADEALARAERRVRG